MNCTKRHMDYVDDYYYKHKHKPEGNNFNMDDIPRRLADFKKYKEKYPLYKKNLETGEKTFLKWSYHTIIWITCEVRIFYNGHWFYQWYEIRNWGNDCTETQEEMNDFWEFYDTYKDIATLNVF